MCKDKKEKHAHGRHSYLRNMPIKDEKFAQSTPLPLSLDPGSTVRPPGAKWRRPSSGCSGCGKASGECLVWAQRKEKKDQTRKMRERERCV